MKKIDQVRNPFAEDTGEKPSADYLAWVDQEIQKGLDQADNHPDKMISTKRYVKNLILNPSPSILRHLSHP